MSYFNLAAALVVGVVLMAYWVYQSSSEREKRQTYGPNSGRSAPPQPHNDCSICRDELGPPLEILPCAHLFHRNCIKKWFERRMKCPVCRTRIDDKLVNDYIQRLSL